MNSKIGKIHLSEKTWKDDKKVKGISLQIFFFSCIIREIMRMQKNAGINRDLILKNLKYYGDMFVDSDSCFKS